MQITQEFLQEEIRSLELEIEKASAFILKAQGALDAYKLLINRIQAPNQEPSNG